MTNREEEDEVKEVKNVVEDGREKENEKIKKQCKKEGLH